MQAAVDGATHDPVEGAERRRRGGQAQGRGVAELAAAAGQHGHGCGRGTTRLRGLVGVGGCVENGTLP